MAGTQLVHDAQKCAAVLGQRHAQKQKNPRSVACIRLNATRFSRQETGCTSC
ncbi:hypothetical protein SF83666_c27990 [Sinorhizobium fredii CCBAU 83666]|nr:hypothetical protein SF83666_c27990 [Sinorhizobium fredii CCBAU 83666]